MLSLASSDWLFSAALGAAENKRGILSSKEYRELLDLTGRLYDAAMDNSLWPDTLRQICHVFRCSGIDLFILDRLSGSFPFSVSYRIEQDGFGAYNEFFIKLERPTNSSLGHSDQQLSSTHLRIRKLKIDSGQQTSGLRSYLSANLLSPEVGGAYVSLQRPERDGNLDEATACLFAAFAPHLAQIIAVSRRLDDLEFRAAASSDALNHLPFGVILLDTNGRVILTNEAAQQVIDSSDGLYIAKHRLYALKPKDNADLQKLIVKAGGMANGSGDGRTSMALPRPSGLRAYALIFLPLANPNLPSGIGRLVAIVISDPERQLIVSEELLTRLCGLTKTEAALASLLTRGLSITEAAEQQGISPKTARLHLDHIFRKTETHRQPDLVRFLLTLVAIVPFDRNA